ncbi:HTH-type transcriptional regulator [Rhynchospora pubera]|uniref:HTH-type transcriptional regulator n=1 Tax=Rhynchospora pubera TaxID=906938 RepID=A0AAV8HAT3_9POAL|nr:HTH-type transcriptional regulator [Rhynchospora pubera]
MGQCTSAQATSPATVKLILPDGSLREFSWPVRPAYILGKDEQASFVCDSDTMEIDQIVTATAADKELRLGQIYFVLPRSMLNRPLKAEEMAALAVRASGALAKVSGSKKGHKGTVAPLVFEIEEEIKEEKKKGGERKNRGKGRKFAPGLSAIPERD